MWEKLQQLFEFNYNLPISCFQYNCAVPYKFIGQFVKAFILEMDCFFSISHLNFCCSCASCAAPTPRWVLWSLMNSREACNPYISAHTG